jgi:hypothetical protein
VGVKKLVVNLSGEYKIVAAMNISEKEMIYYKASFCSNEVQISYGRELFEYRSACWVSRLRYDVVSADLLKGKQGYFMMTAPF